MYVHIYFLFLDVRTDSFSLTILQSVKSCHSCCSKTVLKGSVAMSSGKQPDPDLVEVQGFSLFS